MFLLCAVPLVATVSFYLFLPGLAAVILFLFLFNQLVSQEAYWKATSLQVKKDRKKERKKLVEAFNFLDPDGNGVIDPVHFSSVVRVYWGFSLVFFF